MTAAAIAGSRLLSLGEAAEQVGLSTRTLRRRIAAGDLPAYRSGRRIIRVRTTDLDRIFRRVPTARR